MYPTDDIKYKIGFLNMKEQAGNMLAPDEFKYRNSVNEFIKHYDAVKLDKELQKVAMYKDTIIDYLNKRELEISQDIPKTRVIKKCAAMQNALECIRYLKKGGLKYFFYYIMDNYPKDDIDTYDYISSVIIKNKGKNADAQYIYNYGNVFECDPATHRVNFNSSLIALIRGYLTNDRTLYNKVENVFDEEKMDSKFSYFRLKKHKKIYSLKKVYISHISFKDRNDFYKEFKLFRDCDIGLNDGNKVKKQFEDFDVDSDDEVIQVGIERCMNNIRTAINLMDKKMKNILVNI